MNIQTIPGKCYGVTSSSGCTVTDSDGKLLATASAGEQKVFQATTKRTVLSDNAAVVFPFAEAPALSAGSGGSGGDCNVTIYGLGAIACGRETQISDMSASVCIGDYANATGFCSTALGVYATATGYYSTALGEYVLADADNALAMGNYASATNNFATAIGSNSLANKTDSIAFGTGAFAGGNSSVAIGPNSLANNSYSTAIGPYCKNAASGTTAVLAGYEEPSDENGWSANVFQMHFFVKDGAPHIGYAVLDSARNVLSSYAVDLSQLPHVDWLPDEDENGACGCGCGC